MLPTSRRTPVLEIRLDEGCRRSRTCQHGQTAEEMASWPRDQVMTIPRLGGAELVDGKWKPDQPAASAAISARDLRPRSVADFNCPQAAMMSSPRGVRIGLA